VRGGSRSGFIRWLLVHGRFFRVGSFELGRKKRREDQLMSNRFVSKEVRDILKKEPKVLPLWDPMLVMLYSVVTLILMSLAFLPSFCA